MESPGGDAVRAPRGAPSSAPTPAEPSSRHRLGQLFEMPTIELETCLASNLPLLAVLAANESAVDLAALAVTTTSLSKLISDWRLEHVARITKQAAIVR